MSFPCLPCCCPDCSCRTCSLPAWDGSGGFFNCATQVGSYHAFDDFGTPGHPGYQSCDFTYNWTLRYDLSGGTCTAICVSASWVQDLFFSGTHHITSGNSCITDDTHDCIGHCTECGNVRVYVRNQLGGPALFPSGISCSDSGCTCDVTTLTCDFDFTCLGVGPTTDNCQATITTTLDCPCSP